MKKLNRVILIGRTNVGKSALFNRLSSTVKSLIFDEAGVTRDYIKDTVTWKDTTFELIDSAGLSFKKSADPLLEKVRLQALDLLQTASVIVFVVDGAAGLLPEDHEIAKAAHKSGKSVILAINKIDTKLAQEQLYEFDRLGFKNTEAVAALHGIGVPELLDKIVVELAQAPSVVLPQKPQFKVALLGKPNVGKSSLMNALLQQERSLVTDIPGTTREAISERIAFFKEDIELIDTPGIRRKRSVEEELEGLMVKSALRAVREADIILLLIDASAGAFSDQELKLAYYSFENQKKALVIIYNKQDLTDAESKERLAFSLEEHEHLFKKLVSINISAKTGKNVGTILPTVHEVWERYNKQFSNDELTLLFKQALIRTPLYKSGSPIWFSNAEQIKTAPITIVVYIDNPKWFDPSQQGFFENVLRSHSDLRGVPIHFIARKAA